MRNIKCKMKNAESKDRPVNIYTCCFLLLVLSVLPVAGCKKLLSSKWLAPQRTSSRSSDNASISVGELVPVAVRILDEGLADESPLVRANTIEVVAAARQVRLMPKVQKLLKDDFVPVRFAAALAVGDMEYGLAASSVKQLLEDENQNVKMAAAYALAKISSSSASGETSPTGGQDIGLISRAIAGSDQNVRANAALLLGKSGDRSSLKFLYWALQNEDSDDKVRFQAAEAIAMLGDERIYPKLWSMLISAYADDRVVGVRSMGALGTTEAKNALITMLDDDILEVRLTAAEQLGMHGDTSGKPVVLDVFEKNQTAGFDKESQERINVLTAIAIGEVGSASLTKFLPRLLENESEFVRIAAAKAVLRRTMGK